MSHKYHDDYFGLAGEGVYLRYRKMFKDVGLMDHALYPALV